LPAGGFLVRFVFSLCDPEGDGTIGSACCPDGEGAGHGGRANEGRGAYAELTITP